MFGRTLSIPSPSTHGLALPNSFISDIHADILTSTELIFRSRLTWLLIFGPIALIGKTGIFGESTCFVLAGLTLIPLAERLSFVTEEVANHTNQTIGALLNATFGNAPELLISSAALQEGFYRVVQLTLLGSMLTNLLFVFGLSCLIGGLRFQVQELRIVSGNASIGMLMLAVAGLALPAALMLSDEMISRSEEKEYVDKNFDGKSDINDGPTFSMVGFSRFNAVIMITGYLLYLLFQLGSHSDEFEDIQEGEEDDEAHTHINGTNIKSDEEGAFQKNIPSVKRKARKNKFCHRLLWGYHENDHDIIERGSYLPVGRLSSIREMEMVPQADSGDEIDSQRVSESQSLPERDEPKHIDMPQSRSEPGVPLSSLHEEDEENTSRMSNISSRKRAGTLTRKEGDFVSPRSRQQTNSRGGFSLLPQLSSLGYRSSSSKSHCSDGSDEEPYMMTTDVRQENNEEEGTLLGGQHRVYP
ncbi:hypothetical protein ACHAWF_003315 [Thalassiosira exigua]